MPLLKIELFGILNQELFVHKSKKQMKKRTQSLSCCLACCVTYDYSQNYIFNFEYSRNQDNCRFFLQERMLRLLKHYLKNPGSGPETHTNSHLSCSRDMEDY